jgi:hypothetical protein
LIMHLYAIEDGNRTEGGGSDDRDLYVVAADQAEAVTIWQQYYLLDDDESPYRIWRINAATVTGPPRALTWADELTEMEV